MILIGIDIGAGANSAISVYNSKTKGFYEIKSGTVFFILSRVKFWHKKFDGGAVAVVEDNTLAKSVFNVWKPYLAKLTQFFYKRIGSIQGLERDFHAILKRGQDVGKNKYLCKIFTNELISLGIPILRVSPSDRDRADKQKKRFGITLTAKNLEMYKMPTKTTAQQFKEITGYTARTNEHQRDAAMLVYNNQFAKLIYVAKKHHNLQGFVSK